MPAPTTFLEQAVFALLNGVAGGGPNYPLMAPQNVRPPYRIYQRIDGTRFGSMDGPSGLAQARIQVDSYAPTYEAAKLDSETVRQAIDGFSGTIAGIRIGGVSQLLDLPDQIDPEAQTETGQKAFRAAKDYLFTFET